MPRLFKPVLATLLFALPLPMAAQDRPGGGANDTPREEGGRDQQRSRWEIPDDATSNNNRTLERILQRYPDSDADKDGELTAEEARRFIERQRDAWRERGNWRRNRIEPTFDNVKYGPADKHHFDLYRADTDGPAPLVLFFHGGQFITGDERSTSTLDVRGLLQAGISVASIDYRETNEEPFPGPFDDAAAAIQFIRFYAEQLHIDPARIAGVGEEAGGNLALYLALHDDQFDRAVRLDLEDGKIEDPREALPEGPIVVSDEDAGQEQWAQTDADESDAESGNGGEANETWELEQEEKEAELVVDSLDDLMLEQLIPWDAEAVHSASTTLAAAAASHPIATFDPRAWKQQKLPMNDHERLMSKYLGVRYLEPLNDPEVIGIVESVSPLALIDGGDPPLLLLSRYADLPLTDETVWTIMRHHPEQSRLIANAMRRSGNEVVLRYRGMRNDPGIRTVDFLIKYLK